MVLTILKIVAGVVVAGVIAMLMLAVLSGLVSSARALRRVRKADDDE
jgi:hypothetical protein